MYLLTSIGEEYNNLPNGYEIHKTLKEAKASMDTCANESLDDFASENSLKDLSSKDLIDKYCDRGESAGYKIYEITTKDLEKLVVRFDNENITMDAIAQDYHDDIDSIL